jgi:hypothetical protein
LAMKPGRLAGVSAEYETVIFVNCECAVNGTINM